MKTLSAFLIIGFLGLLPASILASENEIIYDFRTGRYNQSINELYQQKKVTNPTILYYQGLSYLHGYSVPRHLEEGLKLITESAEKGYLPAQQLIARYYLLKKDDPEKAFPWFLKAANQNDVDAQMFVSAAYLFGYGTKRNPDKARKYYIAASKNGNAIAQFTLAQHFLEGKNKNNHKLAVLWLVRSAKLGNKKAAYELGRLYRDGIGTNKDKTLSEQWFKQAGDVVVEQKKSGWVNYTPKESKQKAIAWLMNDAKTTTKFANFRIYGILSDWENKATMQQYARNRTPIMLFVNPTKIFSYQFETIDPKTIKMAEVIDIIGKINYENKKPEFKILLYPLPEIENESVLTKLKQLAVFGNSQAQFKLGQLYQAGKDVEQSNEKAFELYQKAVDQNNLKAEFSLAAMYLNGIGVEKDFDKAFELLEKSAFRGSGHAQYLLGQIFEYGVKDNEGKQQLKENKEYARAMYSLATVNDLDSAKYRLADLHISGHFNEIETLAAKQDKQKEIISLYETAVKNGVKDAELSLAYYYIESTDKEKQEWAYKVAGREVNNDNKLGVLLLALLYDRGIGVSESKSKAIKYYKQAADQNNPVAEFILGTYYFNGNGVRKDSMKALDLLQKAANSNLPFAQYNLAVIMHNTDPNSNFLPFLQKADKQNYIRAKLLLADYQITKPDDAKKIQSAAKIYEQLAERGYPKAQLKLGYMYEHGIHFKVNNELAEKWYQKAAEQNDVYAQFFLAKMYQVGKLGEPNFEQADFWYQKAAEQNFVPAIVALGFINETMSHDYQTALKWYEKANETGNLTAKYNLGLMYEYGKGMKVDYDKAYEQYLEGSEEEYAPAHFGLAKLYLKGRGLNKNANIALSLFKKSADKNDSDAQFQLAVMYERGIGTLKNKGKAIEYYKKAVANGSYLAGLQLKRINEEAKKEQAAVKKGKEQG